jgi:hypothetical protein
MVGNPEVILAQPGFGSARSAHTSNLRPDDYSILVLKLNSICQRPSRFTHIRVLK